MTNKTNRTHARRLGLVNKGRRTAERLVANPPAPRFPRPAAIRFLWPIAIVAALGFSSCHSLSPYEPPAPIEFQPPPQRIRHRPEPYAVADGSLWIHDDDSWSLFSDTTAHRVGDLLFVNVRESAKATGSADTDLKKESEINAGIRNLLGLENNINTINDSDPSDGVDPAHLIRADTKNDYKAETETVRQGVLTARITAEVVDVLPNGNLRIYGSQIVTINNENQVLIVSGIARPIDIAPDNSIDSYLLANARIQFTGRGVLSDKQRPGWGTRIIDWIWPF